MTLERILLKGAILILRLHLPTHFLKLTSFLGSRVLFWKQLGLFPELGSESPYPWVRFEPGVSYDKV